MLVRIWAPEPIGIQFDTSDYVGDTTRMAEVKAIARLAAYRQASEMHVLSRVSMLKHWNILKFFKMVYFISWWNHAWSTKK